MRLTVLDHAIAASIVDALTSRWPFVRTASPRQLGTWNPRTFEDSLARDVVTGRMPWASAKATVAVRHEAAGRHADAALEYEGLARDQPWNEGPFRFAGRALLAAKRPADARVQLERAHAIRPTAYTSFALAGIIAADTTALDRAIQLTEESLRLGGPAGNPAAMFQLSLLYGRRGDVQAARAVAARLAGMAPGYPGLRDWLATLSGGTLKK